MHAVKHMHVLLDWSQRAQTSQDQALYDEKRTLFTSWLLISPSLAHILTLKFSWNQPLILVRMGKGHKESIKAKLRLQGCRL